MDRMSLSLAGLKNFAKITPEFEDAIRAFVTTEWTFKNVRIEMVKGLGDSQHLAITWDDPGTFFNERTKLLRDIDCLLAGLAWGKP